MTSVWNQSSMDVYSMDLNLAQEGLPCELRVSETEIILSYEGDSGLIRWEGTAAGDGHYSLSAVAGAKGKGSLHQFPDGKILEGFWIEDGAMGMWRIHLD